MGEGRWRNIAVPLRWSVQVAGAGLPSSSRTARSFPSVAILRVLAASGARGRAFVRRGTAAHLDALAGSRMVCLQQPVPIRQALEGARVILHHGSLLTSEEALV